MKNISKFLFISLLFVAAINTTIKYDNMSDSSLFTSKVSIAQQETGGETDYKIKDYCECKKNGKWTGSMSITACEAYTWYPPMEKQNCVTTKCPIGEAC